MAVIIVCDVESVKYTIKCFVVIDKLLVFDKILLFFDMNED